MLGRASGTLDAATFGAVLVGAAVMAPVVDHAGLTVAVLVAGSPPLVAGLVTAAFVRRLDGRADAGLAAVASRVRVLAQVSALVGAHRIVLERLAAAAQERSAPVGTVVVHEGQRAEDFFVVVDGAFEVTSSDATGRSAQMALLRTGDFFGEIGLLGSGRRTASVRAATDGTLLCIPGDEFVEVVTGAPRLASMFRDVVATRLASTKAATMATEGG